MKQLLRSPLVLLAAIAVVRSAGFAFGILNIDESDYMIFGAGLLKGMLPYRDLVEIKPPLGYLTYLPAGLFGGMHTLPMRVLGVLWVFAAAMLLRAAARRWARDTDPEGAGWAAAWLFLLSLLCEIPSFGSELMLALPAAGALYFFARAQCPPIVGTPTISADAERSRRPLFLAAAGLCAALASLYRPQGAVVALALGLSLLAPLLARRAPSAAGGAPGPAPRGRAALDALGDALLLTLGFALPWAACAAVYAGFHQLPAFYEWVFVRNFEYAGKGAAGSALARGAQSTALCLGATIVPWVLAVRASARWTRREAGGEPSGSRAGRPYARALVLLLWLSWLAVAAGGRFYEHYYLQFATPLALLGAPEAARLARAKWRPSCASTARRARRSSSGATTRPSTCSPAGCPARATRTPRCTWATSTRRTCPTTSTQRSSAPRATWPRRSPTCARESPTSSSTPRPPTSTTGRRSHCAPSPSWRPTSRRTTG